MGSEQDQACVVCGERKSHDEMMPLEMVRPTMMASIREELPGVDEAGQICTTDLRRIRSAHVMRLLAAEKGKLTRLDDDVIRSLAAHETLSQNVNAALERRATLGARLSDRINDAAGSWTFIASFAVFCTVWMAVNAGLLVFRPFDPYPFILLNLMLSCIAALQAPVIMMSQKRQETRDRLQAEHDYQVNLKAELEIRQLHEKLDHMIAHQWRRLVEIQRKQTELLEQLSAPRKD